MMYYIFLIFFILVVLYYFSSILRIAVQSWKENETNNQQSYYDQFVNHTLRQYKYCTKLQ